MSVSEYNGSSTTITCKDSKNNVNYTQIAQPNNGGIQLGVFWYIPPVGGTPFTIQASNTYYSAMTIDEYSMPAGSSGLVVDSFGSDNTGAKTLASNLTVTGTDLIYASCATSSGTIGAGSGFNLRGQIAYVYATDEGVSSEDSLDVTSNINPSWSNYPTVMVGVAFKPLLPFTFNATGLAISVCSAGRASWRHRTRWACRSGMAAAPVRPCSPPSAVWRSRVCSAVRAVRRGRWWSGHQRRLRRGCLPWHNSPATGMAISGYPGTSTGWASTGRGGDGHQRRLRRGSSRA